MGEQRVHYGKHAQEGMDTEDYYEEPGDEAQVPNLVPLPGPQYGVQKAGGVFSEVRALEIQRDASRQVPPGSMVSREAPEDGDEQ